MANSINKFSISKSFFLSIDRNYPTVIDSMYELDESDIWNSSPVDLNSVEASKTASRQTIRRSKVAAKSASVPVDIPDWSKILKDESRQVKRVSERNYVDEECTFESSGGGDRVPPHVLVARELDNNKSTAVAYSVYEGLGRTLKGRDLSKVRNAIWEITGFQD